MGKKAKPSSAAATASDRAYKSSTKQHGKQKRSHHASPADDATHYAAFTSQLSSISLRLQSIQGDGNCLFRSIADQVDGNQHNHGHFRALACKQITAQAALYAPFLDDSGGGKSASASSAVSSYVDRMSRDGEWGGNLELVALSRALCRDVVVHQLGAPRLVIDCGSDNKTEAALHVAYHSEEHYSSVRRLDDTAPPNSPPLPITLPTTTAASPAASTSVSGLERMVMARSGCGFVQRVRAVLREMEGDSESAVEVLKAEQEAEDSERRDKQAHDTAKPAEQQHEAQPGQPEQEEQAPAGKVVLTAKQRRLALKAERAERKSGRARERKLERIKQKAEADDTKQHTASSAQAATDGGLVQDLGSLTI